MPSADFCPALDGGYATSSHGELERRGHCFARYADDLVLLLKSPRAAGRVMQSITQYLEATLKLKVNLAKSKVVPMSECGFLGFTIEGKKMRRTDKARAFFKHRVKDTARNWGVSMHYRLRKLAIPSGLDGVLRISGWRQLPWPAH